MRRDEASSDHDLSMVLGILSLFAGAVGERKPFNNQHPTTNNQHRTTNIEQPTTNIEHPTTNIEQPTSDNQHPTSNIERRIRSQ